MNTSDRAVRTAVAIYSVRRSSFFVWNL